MFKFSEIRHMVPITKTFIIIQTVLSSKTVSKRKIFAKLKFIIQGVS